MTAPGPHIQIQALQAQAGHTSGRCRRGRDWGPSNGVFRLAPRSRPGLAFEPVAFIQATATRSLSFPHLYSSTSPSPSFKYLAPYLSAPPAQPGLVLSPYPGSLWNWHSLRQLCSLPWRTGQDVSAPTLIRGQRGVARGPRPRRKPSGGRACPMVPSSARGSGISGMAEPV